MQFFQLFKKNFTLWRRGPCGAITEQLIPTLFALLLLWLGSLASEKNTPTRSYLGSPESMRLSPNGIAAELPFPTNYVTHLRSINTGRFPHMKQCTGPFADEDIEAEAGQVALGPSGNPIAQKLAQFFNAYGMRVTWWDNTEAIHKFIKSSRYSERDASGVKQTVCFGVTFESSGGADQYKYSLHYNTTMRRGKMEIYRFDEPQVIPFEKESDEWEFARNSGALFVQNMVNNLIIEDAKGVSNFYLKNEVTKMPVNAFTTSNIKDIGTASVPIFTIFSLSVIFLRFVYGILVEKEARITENMRNMGMNMFAHYMSWISFTALTLFTSSLPWVVIMALGMFKGVNFLIVWSLFLLPGLVLIALGFFVSAFFTKAKPGVLCALIIFFLLYGASIAMSAISNLTTTANFFFALSPFAGLDKTVQILLLVVGNGADFGLDLMFKSYLNFRVIYFVILCFAEIIFFTLGGMYLDQVFPSEIGVRKHPLFCFGVKSGGSVPKGGEDGAEEGKRKPENFEVVGQNLKVQSENNETLRIENLYKIYGNGKRAVNGLNLEMYNSQIFALLGHNGAGKTTTISMISGLLSITKGNITVFGKNSRTDMEAIKQLMGVCPQKNPIYESLTVYEHLKLYADIKGAKGSPKELEAQVDEILTDIDLFDKKHYTAGKLSGGQKRKLCVAISFIGGSKVILLDEPTSGMDTYARRRLWDMLKKYKKDKIIILTTHYMDEADYLGDRIGIMGDGELLTCGTPLFLKKTFGVGYNLTVVKKSAEVSTEELTRAISGSIAGAELEGDIGKELKYILPQDRLADFEKLFRMLEDEKERYGVEGFGISLTTLEEVFLKVAVGLGKHDSIDATKEEVFTGEEVQLKDLREKSSFKIFQMHFWALLVKRFIYFRKDVKGIICEVVIPLAVMFTGLLVTLINLVYISPGGDFTPQIFDESSQFWVAGNYNPAVTSTIDSLPKVTSKVIASGGVGSFEQQIRNEEVPSRYYAAFFQTFADSSGYDYQLFFNSSVPNSVMVGQNAIAEAALRTTTGNSGYVLRANFEPLPLTEQTSAVGGAVSGYFAVFFFTLAYSFIPSSNIMFIVKEREENVKHQQLVSGVSLMAYWFSNFVIDIGKFLLVAAGTILCIFIYGIDNFKDGDHIWMSIGLVVGFGLANTPFTYLLSFMFKSPSSAQIFTFILNFLFGFVVMTGSFVLRLIESTRNFHFNFSEYLFRLVPMFNFAFGYLMMTYSLFNKLIFKLDDIPKAFSWYGSLKEFIALLVGFVVYFGLIFFVETWPGLGYFFSKKKQPAMPAAEPTAIEMAENNKSQQLNSINPEKNPGTAPPMPIKPASVKDIPVDIDDIRAEDNYVKNTPNLAIKVEGLAKAYPIYEGNCCGGKAITYKHAVKGINFGIAPGECFGLLGTNGAGKTTTFKMLCGEVAPTQGYAAISGMNVATDMKHIRHLIGYCPQFDALLDKLTARQHLELYAAIKGIPAAKREQLIREKIRQLNLTKYEHVDAGTYSGGNKRKLSVAIALLGNPPIVFLDEPSSGMDPEARRFMWSMVSRVSSQTKMSSIVLTTHSMEEAEALSTKLAIMVEGKIKCIGPVQSLKNKYGKGFELETKLLLPTRDKLLELAQRAGLPPPAELGADGVPIGGAVEAKVSLDHINQALTRLGKQAYSHKISAQGEGSSIFNEIRLKKEAPVSIVLEFIYLQDRVAQILEFLQGKFGRVSVLESFLINYKFKVEDDVRLSSLFGEMERNKQILEIDQYSVKQTSIEQIFISFANERVAD